MCYYWSDSATHSTGPKISTFTQPNATATHRGTTDNLSNHIYCVLVEVVHVILAALVGVKSQHKLNRSGNVSSLCVRWNSKRARLESARLVEPACGILDGKCEHEDAQPLALARTQTSSTRGTSASHTHCNAPRLPPTVLTLRIQTQTQTQIQIQIQWYKLRCWPITCTAMTQHVQCRICAKAEAEAVEILHGSTEHL